MGDTSETNTKVLSRELFLGVVALKTPIPQKHYLSDKVPFLKSGHICVCMYLYIMLLSSQQGRNVITPDRQILYFIGKRVKPARYYNVECKYKISHESG